MKSLDFAGGLTSGSRLGGGPFASVEVGARGAATGGLGGLATGARGATGALFVGRPIGGLFFKSFVPFVSFVSFETAIAAREAAIAALLGEALLVAA